MNRRGVDRLKESFEWFVPCGPALIGKVMRQLADDHPGIRAMFPDDVSNLNRKIFDTMKQVMSRIDRFETLEKPLADLGVKCDAEGAVAAHYAIVRDELLAAMRELSGDDWSVQLDVDWTELLDAVSGAMIAGAVQRRIRTAA